MFPSTIGAAGLNCPVRNGEGWNPRAIAAFSFYLYSSLFLTLLFLFFPFLSSYFFLLPPSSPNASARTDGVCGEATVPCRKPCAASALAGCGIFGKLSGD